MNVISKLPYILTISLLTVVSSCADFVDIDPPRTDLTKSIVFDGDETANAALLDIYYQMHERGFASGDLSSISFICALSSDELINGITFIQDYSQFNQNVLLATNSTVLSLWSDLYKCIYKVNAIDEGLILSGSISEKLKQQINGEAKFIRAFCYFYLVNLWGDVPLVLTTDYKVNQTIGRTPKTIVFEQIVTDLLDAEGLLENNFSYSNNERTRINRGAATAMLARVYLYLEDWAKAEAKASAIIDNTTLYSLMPLSDVFVKNNREAIWQLLPLSGNAWDVETFLFYGHQITPQLLTAFETEDQRRLQWIERDVIWPFEYANKYKDFNYTSSEYSIVLRLAEQYLIRAEARAMQGNLSLAQEDINSIRNRAGLGNTSASDQLSLLAAIQQERRVELFTEWGHRWLDLKRTGEIDLLMDPIKDEWTSTDSLYPIPEAQLLNDPAMRYAQNPGY